MEDVAFSRFDSLTVPVLICSPELKLLYANRIVRCSFPESSLQEPFLLFFTDRTIQSLSRRLAAGESCRQPAENGSELIFLFEPAASPTGTVDKVFVLIENGDDRVLKLVEAFSEVCFCSRFYDELFCTLERMAHSIRLLSKLSVERDTVRLTSGLREMRMQLLKALRFLNKLDCVSTDKPSMTFCDATNILEGLARRIPDLKCESSCRCLLPLAADACICLLTNVIGALMACQTERKKVTVTFAQTDDTVQICFSALVDRLKASEAGLPDPETQVRTDFSYYAVCRRVEACGGTVDCTMASGGRGLKLCLTFPKLEPRSGELFVNAYEAIPDYFLDLFADILSLNSCSDRYGAVFAEFPENNGNNPD